MCKLFSGRVRGYKSNGPTPPFGHPSPRGMKKTHPACFSSTADKRAPLAEGNIMLDCTPSEAEGCFTSQGFFLLFEDISPLQDNSDSILLRVAKTYLHDEILWYERVHE